MARAKKPSGFAVMSRKPASALHRYEHELVAEVIKDNYNRDNETDNYYVEPVYEEES